ncbi:MAG: hypothetical protein ACNI25_06635 [Halarcobacter sp.]
MESSKQILENLSRNLYHEKDYYRYNNEAKITPKYTKGVLVSIEYLQELIYCYLKREQELKQEMISKIQEQELVVNQLNSSEYKQGILDILTYAKDEINGNKPLYNSHKKYLESKKRENEKKL